MVQLLQYILFDRVDSSHSTDAGGRDEIEFFQGETGEGFRVLLGYISETARLVVRSDQRVVIDLHVFVFQIDAINGLRSCARLKEEE